MGKVKKIALILGLGLAQFAATTDLYASAATQTCMKAIFDRTDSPYNMLTGWDTFASDMSQGRPAPFSSGCSPWPITTPLNLANTGITSSNGATCPNAIAISFMGSTKTNAQLITMEMTSNIGRWQKRTCNSTGNVVDGGTYLCPLSPEVLNTIANALINCYKTAY